jgi:hypothetical protein
VLRRPAVVGGASTDFALTAAEAGRIYLSLDRALQTDAPDGANPSDPDYRTRFDKVELTYDPIHPRLNHAARCRHLEVKDIQ